MAETSPLAHSPTLVQGDASGARARSGSARVADERDSLDVGAQVGEYIVDGFLGAGAMGEVYAGTHPVIGKKVAIKVLKRSVAASPDGAERFKREARAVNQIDHPSVIDVFSFGRLDDGRLYLVMDLVAGRSLRTAIMAGPLPVATALAVLAQIADALDAAHAKGVVHRDLKPDNVMLAGDDASPKVLVLDFGLAKLLAPEGAPPSDASMLTGQGTWLGTPSYMAPEQWSADGAGPASDRYALGVMAFELLSGSLPFEAANLPQMMEQHFRAAVPALSARGAAIATAAFDPVVARAMAKDPDARFATGRDMVEALRDAAGTSARASRTGKRMLPAVAGIGVLGLSVGVVLSLRGDEPAPAAPPAPARPAASAGTLRVELDSIPRGAEIHRGNTTTRTPTYLDVPAGEHVEIDVKKPGYATVHHAFDVVAGVRIPAFHLVAIDGFQGIWALPTGELRSFHRVGDRVEVFKLAAVDAEPAFFRAYDLVPADNGVSFGTTETILQPGRPEHPSCYIPYTTEYHYDPRSDALSVRRERIVVDVVGGACIRKSSAMSEPDVLGRATRQSATERETLAPVGVPKRVSDAPGKLGKKPVRKAPPPQLQKARDLGAQSNAVPDLAGKVAPKSAKSTVDRTFEDIPAQQQQAPRSKN